MIKNVLICSLLISNLLIASDDQVKLRNKLQKEFPGIIIKEMKSDKAFKFTWELIIQQLIDHNNPNNGTFPQHIYLYHKSFKKPNVIVTEGYEVADRIYEPTMILNANQFSVEFRFYGQSAPEKIPWQYLNHLQALDDLHQIKNKFSKIYKKSWTATGISKGGTTCALYSLSYPSDLKAAVAYVAPFVLAQEDQRTIDHYKNKVGTKECRDRVFEFQRSMLKHRQGLVPMIEGLAIRDNVSFSISADRVLEYAAMEFPFSFWQWGFTCNVLPKEPVNDTDIFDFVEEVVDFNYYDDPTVAQFEPSFYQFMSEFGYYGFDTTGLSDLIMVEKHPSNLTFCPKGVEIKYDPKYMKEMTDKAINNGKNIIYIYGGLDTWYSCGVTPSMKTNCVKFVKEDMGHRVKIRNFSDSDKLEINRLLKKWTKAKTYSLPY
ncbi:MAG: S28 family serine protease [Saprospiraceae bacterium]